MLDIFMSESSYLLCVLILVPLVLASLFRQQVLNEMTKIYRVLKSIELLLLLCQSISSTALNEILGRSHSLFDCFQIGKAPVKLELVILNK